jgi:hypothetical protein
MMRSWRRQSGIVLKMLGAWIISLRRSKRRKKKIRMGVVTLDVNNPYKKLGGGSLDQALFRKKKPQPIPVAAPPPTESESPGEETTTGLQTKTNLLANQQTGKLAKKQTNKPANSQTRNLPLSTREKKKYGTYLREDSILDIQIRAAQTRLKDHELLQEIVDAYFNNLKK